jgi:hypothetical protein
LNKVPHFTALYLCNNKTIKIYKDETE